LVCAWSPPRWRRLFGAPALAELKLPDPAVDKSTVAKRGFFYVGGHYVGEPGKQIMRGQIYVEVLAPKEQHRPYPLVLMPWQDPL